jgi:hypothetical protein
MQMIELEHGRIRFTAIDTRVALEVAINKRSRFGPAANLARLDLVQVLLTAFPKVRLEAFAAPPLSASPVVAVESPSRE